MSSVVEFDQDAARAYAERKNQRIGNWLSKLASYVAHSREFRERSQEARAEFWADLVLVMAEADLPDAVWSADAIRFCRRKFKFFPCAAELCEALSEYAEPIRAAIKERWERDRRRAIPAGGADDLPPNDRHWLAFYRKLAGDGFRAFAEERGTNVDEAKHAALTLLRQQAPAAYAGLDEVEKRDGYGRRAQA